MLPIQPVIEEHPLRIDLVKDGISVALVACCKYYYFPVLLHFLQKGNRIGANVEPDFKGAAVNADGKFDVGLRLVFFEAVDEGFIKV